MTEQRPTGRPGRWRTGAESRRRILDAARVQFREHGYSGTTVRAVAAAAGVDPAMVFYFFRTKQGLFGAVIEMPDDLPAAIESIFTGGLAGIGERIIRIFVQNMDKSDHVPLMALTRSAPTHGQSEALLREFIDREITSRLVAMLDTPDAALRVGMVNVQLLGLAEARYVLRMEPVASASVDDLATRFGAIVECCLSGPPGDGASPPPGG